MKDLDVIALGGNALLPAGESGAIEEQFAVTRQSMVAIARLIADGRRVVLTHGNGPIVGNIVLRNEALRDTIAPMPLGVCVADSQGGIGYMLQQVLRNALRSLGKKHEVVTLITQVTVDPKDPSFQHPTKPIGPYYSEEQARKLRREHGWHIIKDSNRGYRRAVPSPRPIEVIEGNVVRRLLEAGMVVITVGGGGIPVVRQGQHLEGVEAVVDKDYTTSVLARDLGADRMILLTDVDAVYRNYDTPEAEALHQLSACDAKALLETGVLPAGSMGSKLEAAVDFVVHGGRVAIITQPVSLMDALAGKSGTSITKEPQHAG